MTNLHPWILPLGAAAAGFGLPLAALAQATHEPAVAAAGPDAPAADTTPGQLPTITARGRREPTGKDSLQAPTTRIGKSTQELRDMPQSMSVITEKLIDDRHLDTLKEALHQTAGISFMAAEGGEEDIRLRGYSLASTGDIFRDGLRDPAFYERDTFADERLEVLRGSASMLFGRGSTGGVVNQVTKQPQLYGRSEASVTLGTGGYMRGTLDLHRRLGENAALRVNVMDTQADRAGQTIDRQGLAVAARWGIGTRDEFGVDLYHLQHANGIHYGLPWIAPVAGSNERTLLPVDPASLYAMASDRHDGRASMLTLQHIRRFGRGTEWRTTVRLADNDRDLRASAIRLCVRNVNPQTGVVTNPHCPSAMPTLQTLTGATVLTRGNNLKIQRMRSLTLQSDFVTKADWAGVRHEIIAGLDAARDDFDNFGANALAKPPTTIGTPNDGAWVDESKRVTFLNRSFEAKSVGLYAQDMIQLAPTWKLLAGLRWDRFDGRYTSPELPGANGSVTPAAERQRSDSLWSKRLGLLWQPTPLTSFHASWGTSFNTSGDTYQFDALGSRTPPESSENFELGSHLDLLDGNLSLRAALFHAVKKNERNRDADSVTPTNYVLSGQRHATGLELDIAGRLSKTWEVYASYAFIPDAKIDKGVPAAGGSVAQSLQGEPVGSRPGLIPRHAATLWSTWQVAPQWRVGGGLNARSKMAPYQVTAFEAPAYVTGDLMAEWSQGDLALKLNLTNVTNKLYADALYRGHYVPGAGRTLQGTVTWKF